MANNNKLIIVLVSSKGCIMPALETLLAANRALVYEIGDVEDDEAIKYLIDNDISEDVAKQLVRYVGRRMVHLESCVRILKKNKFKCDDDAYQFIKTMLFLRKLSSQKAFLSKMFPGSKTILEAVTKHRDVFPADLLHVLEGNERKEKMKMLLQA